MSYKTKYKSKKVTVESNVDSSIQLFVRKIRPGFFKRLFNRSKSDYIFCICTTSDFISGYGKAKSSTNFILSKEYDMRKALYVIHHLYVSGYTYHKALYRGLMAAMPEADSNYSWLNTNLDTLDDKEVKDVLLRLILPDLIAMQ